MKLVKALRIFIFPVIVWRVVWMYLDPGSGSFIIQILIAGLLGAGLALRGYWSRLFSLFKRSDSSKVVTEESHDEHAE
jgi:hypothetical protein